MAENAPPAGGEAARGQPYYEKLKRDLRQTLQNKRRIDSQLASLEEQIYRQESQYLEDTPGGNIIKGFDNYIKGTSGTGGGAGAGTATRKKSTVQDQERIFSRSSASFMRESSPDSLSQPSHAPTPTRADSNAPTPTSTTAGGNNKSNASGVKRTKKGEKDDDDSESKPPKRLKMTFARGDKSTD